MGFFYFSLLSFFLLMIPSFMNEMEEQEVVTNNYLQSKLFH